MDQELEKRKEKFYTFLKEKKDWIVYIILAAIIWLSFYIRTRNVPLLKDVTTGKFAPVSMDDPNLFLRYASYLLEHGKLMAVDILRYYPFGFPSSSLQEFGLLTNVIVYIYKFLHIFDPKVTIEYAGIIYPVITIGIAFVFFFLFVRKLFNYQIALISTAFLVVLPAFLFRTIAGFVDKEPLGVMFMFMAFYFFVCAWKSEKLKTIIITAFLAGASTTLMGLTWGGVNFIYLTLGAFGLTAFLLNKFDNKKIYAYSIWIWSSFILLLIFFSSRFTYGNLITSLTTSLSLVVFFLIWVDYLLFNKKLLKININLPNSVKTLIITSIIVLLFLIIKQGPGFLYDKIIDIYIHLTKPFATSRWVITVAESHQPYVTDWFAQFGKNYIWLAIIGSIVVFYEIVRALSKRDAWKLTLVYIAFLICFIFNRYAANSKFNGETTLAQIMYIGSIILFILVLGYLYVRLYYKNKSAYEELDKLDDSLIFILLFFMIMLIAARSAIRLVFIFTPALVIIFSYFIYYIYDLISKNIKEKVIKFVLIGALVIVVGLLFFNSYKLISQQAKYAGGGMQQWDYVGQWIRDNTPGDSVFAHWWDYGYWVQRYGERATLSDGGNARGAINYFVGRHVLTAQTNREALELLKANNATHLFIVSEEIGKYPAFSSIGSNEIYDRYSWITTFSLDTQNVRETRNGTSYLYTGGTILDEDLIYQGNLYPARAAGIGAFFLETQNVKDENDTIVGINFAQPKGVLVYNGKQIEIPINCVFFNNQEIKFNNTNGIDGCLRIIPSISGEQFNPIGALLYLSPRVKRTLFTRLYLFNQEDEDKYFKLVYNDEGAIPLAIYSGRLIGPIKIWNITYPNDLVIPKEYYGTEVPDPKVEQINTNYT